MASDSVKVWVKVKDGKRKRRTVSVCVESTADVDGLIDAVLEKVKVNIAPDLVTVEFEGKEIEDSGLLVTEFNTSSQNPLLLKCPDESEGTCMLLCDSLHAGGHLT